jgi:hypothetical protein
MAPGAKGFFKEDKIHEKNDSFSIGMPYGYWNSTLGSPE